MQLQELHVPPSPSECDGQDSGGDFDFKLDGDDDGFIDDFVQEQSKEVHNNDDNKFSSGFSTWWLFLSTASNWNLEC